MAVNPSSFVLAAWGPQTQNFGGGLRWAGIKVPGAGLRSHLLHSRVCSSPWRSQQEEISPRSDEFKYFCIFLSFCCCCCAAGVVFPLLMRDNLSLPKPSASQHCPEEDLTPQLPEMGITRAALRSHPAGITSEPWRSDPAGIPGVLGQGQPHFQPVPKALTVPEWEWGKQ